VGKQFLMEADMKQAVTPWLEQRDRKVCSEHYTQSMSKHIWAPSTYTAADQH